jgi:hypothetical protein
MFSKSVASTFSSKCIALLLWLPFVALDAFADGAYRTVALAGDNAPGTTMTFTSFSSAIINRNGDLSLYGAVQNLPATSAGIWEEVEGSISLVALNNTPTPGGIGAFGTAANLPRSISLDGESTFQTNANGQDVIRGELDDVLQNIVYETGPAPGLSGVQLLQLHDLGISELGATSFLGELTGAGIDQTNNYARWAKTASGFRLVGRSGDSFPLAGVGATLALHQSGGDVINNAGDTAFATLLFGIGQFGSSGAVVAESNGMLRLVALHGQTAPGTTRVFARSAEDNFGRPALNNCGQVAFRGITAPGSQPGVWSEAGGTLHLVSRLGLTAPGTGNTFIDFHQPTLNDSGQTAFIADVGGSSSSNEGIWLESNGVLELVVREGQAAPGTNSGVVFSFNIATQPKLTISPVVLNDRGQLAFKANLTGTGVDASNDVGIWATNLDGTLTLIAREGDSIDVDDGAGVDFRTITSLDFASASGGSVGSEIGFNDYGQLVFSAGFSSGAGVFVANQVQVPSWHDADFDGSNSVDEADLDIWRMGFGMTMADHSDGDADFDCDVDGNDFLIWQRHLGESESLTGVPEPTSTTLLITGTVLFSMRTGIAKPRRRTPSPCAA